MTFYISLYRILKEVRDRMKTKFRGYTGEAQILGEKNRVVGWSRIKEETSKYWMTNLSWFAWTFLVFVLIVSDLSQANKDS